MSSSEIKKETVTLPEVSKRIGRGADELTGRLRRCAMQGIYCPIGFALPPSKEGGQWAYIFPRERFERYMRGDDFTRPEAPA